eukprot:scaffold8916_cov122-Isochrysis_galbana.AAC.6
MRSDILVGLTNIPRGPGGRAGHGTVRGAESKALRGAASTARGAATPAAPASPSDPVASWFLVQRKQYRGGRKALP